MEVHHRPRVTSSPYLYRNIGRLITDCLADVVQGRPDDPIDFIARWLYHYSSCRLYFAEKERMAIAMSRVRREERNKRIRRFERWEAMKDTMYQCREYLQIECPHDPVAKLSIHGSVFKFSFDIDEDFEVDLAEKWLREKEELQDSMEHDTELDGVGSHFDHIRTSLDDGGQLRNLSLLRHKGKVPAAIGGDMSFGMPETVLPAPETPVTVDHEPEPGQKAPSGLKKKTQLPTWKGLKSKIIHGLIKPTSAFRGIRRASHMRADYYAAERAAAQAERQERKRLAALAALGEEIKGGEMPSWWLSSDSQSRDTSETAVSRATSSDQHSIRVSGISGRTPRSSQRIPESPPEAVEPAKPGPSTSGTAARKYEAARTKAKMTKDIIEQITDAISPEAPRRLEPVVSVSSAVSVGTEKGYVVKAEFSTISMKGLEGDHPRADKEVVQKRPSSLDQELSKKGSSSPAASVNSWGSSRQKPGSRSGSTSDDTHRTAAGSSQKGSIMFRKLVSDASQITGKSRAKGLDKRKPSQESSKSTPTTVDTIDEFLGFQYERDMYPSDEELAGDKEAEAPEPKRESAQSDATEKSSSKISASWQSAKLKMQPPLAFMGLNRVVSIDFDAIGLQSSASSGESLSQSATKLEEKPSQDVRKDSRRPPGRFLSDDKVTRRRKSQSMAVLGEVSRRESPALSQRSSRASASGLVGLGFPSRFSASGIGSQQSLKPEKQRRGESLEDEGESSSLTDLDFSFSSEASEPEHKSRAVSRQSPALRVHSPHKHRTPSGSNIALAKSRSGIRPSKEAIAEDSVSGLPHATVSEVDSSTGVPKSDGLRIGSMTDQRARQLRRVHHRKRKTRLRYRGRGFKGVPTELEDEESEEEEEEEDIATPISMPRKKTPKRSREDDVDDSVTPISTQRKRTPKRSRDDDVDAVKDLPRSRRGSASSLETTTSPGKKHGRARKQSMKPQAAFEDDAAEDDLSSESVESLRGSSRRKSKRPSDQPWKSKRSIARSQQDGDEAIGPEDEFRQGKKEKKQRRAKQRHDVTPGSSRHGLDGEEDYARERSPSEDLADAELKRAGKRRRTRHSKASSRHDSAEDLPRSPRSRRASHAGDDSAGTSRRRGSKAPVKLSPSRSGSQIDSAGSDQSFKEKKGQRKESRSGSGIEDAGSGESLKASVKPYPSKSGSQFESAGSDESSIKDGKRKTRRKESFGKLEFGEWSLKNDRLVCEHPKLGTLGEILSTRIEPSFEVWAKKRYSCQHLIDQEVYNDCDRMLERQISETNKADDSETTKGEARISKMISKSDAGKSKTPHRSPRGSKGNK